MGIWANKLPRIEWAYGTTAKTSTGETPFSLAYGTKVVIPVEVGLSSHRRKGFNIEGNDKKL